MNKDTNTVDVNLDKDTNTVDVKDVYLNKSGQAIAEIRYKKKIKKAERVQ